MSLYDDTMTRIAEELTSVNTEKEKLNVQVMDLQQRIDKLNAEMAELDVRAAALCDWRKTFLDNFEAISKLDANAVHDVVSKATAKVVEEGKFDILNGIVTSEVASEPAIPSFDLGYLPKTAEAVKDEPIELVEAIEEESATEEMIVAEPDATIMEEPVEAPEAVEPPAVEDEAPNPDELFEDDQKEYVTHFKANDFAMSDLIRSRKTSRKAVFGKGVGIGGYIYNGKVNRMDYPENMCGATKCMTTLSQCLADKYGSVQKLYDRLTEDGKCRKNRSTGELYDLRLEKNGVVVAESNPGVNNPMVVYAKADDGVLYGLEYPYYVNVIVGKVFKHLSDDLADCELITTAYEEVEA